MKYLVGLKRVRLALSLVGAVIGSLIQAGAGNLYGWEQVGIAVLAAVVAFAVIWGVFTLILWVVKGFIPPGQGQGG